MFETLAAAELQHINLPVAVLVWLMIVPMLLKVDFAQLAGVRRQVRGIGITLLVNWAIKPFSMALLGWLFIRHVFAAWLPADQHDAYIAGLILLAAAPCTAMVFVWSRLCGGEPNFTLAQVALNDTIMVVAFAPIVALLLGVASIHVPWGTLLLSVLLYIVVPVIAAQLWRALVAAPAWAGGAGSDPAADRSVVDRRAAGHAGPAVRIPGRGDPAATADHRAAGGADRDPGLPQCRPSPTASAAG